MSVMSIVIIMSVVSVVKRNVKSVTRNEHTSKVSRLLYNENESDLATPLQVTITVTITVKTTQVSRMEEFGRWCGLCYDH
jgi:hypothetical protein